MDPLLRDDLFPPGEFIKDELDARNWTQEDLAEILGRPLKTVSQILTGKKAIIPQTARELAAAFGTSAELWLNLENAYRLAHETKGQEAVATRARLYELAPVKDMLRRKWITPGPTVAALEVEVLEFLGIPSIGAEPAMDAAARRSVRHGDFTPAQRAWLFRARHLAKAVQAKRFSVQRMTAQLDTLHSLTVSEHEVRRVSSILADMGIRLVVVEHLPRTRIDGATFWLDRHSPVIALSLRYDRIDGFWHTLAHEISHVKNRDQVAIDNDLVGTRRQQAASDVEQRADREASEFLIAREKLESFIRRLRPRFSKNRIIQFANLHGIHPGIVVGQLQYRGAINYSHSREMLVSVRDILTETVLTDGWGNFPGV